MTTDTHDTEGCWTTAERSVEVDDALGESPSDPLTRPLNELFFTARMWSFIERRDLKVLGDLVRLHPTDLIGEKNVGRLTVKHARQVIETLLGREWEIAHAELHGLTYEPLSSNGGCVSALATMIGEERRAASLHAVPGLSVRIMGFAQRSGITTVGELISVPRATLSKARNIGRVTINDTMRTLTAWCGLSWPPSSALGEPVPMAPGIDWSALGLRALLETLLGTLSPRARGVIEAVAGLGVPRTTMRRVGESIGVSESRVCQIIAEAMRAMASEREAIDALEARLDSALAAGAVTFTDLSAREPWFEEAEAFQRLLTLLCVKLPSGRFAVVNFYGERLLSPFAQATLDRAWRSATREAAWLTGVIERDAVVARAAEGLGEAIAERFRARLAARCAST